MANGAPLCYPPSDANHPLVGLASFLLGAGLGVLGTTLLQSPVHPEPEPTAVVPPATAPPVYHDLPARESAVPPEEPSETPIASPQRDLARMTQGPDGARPPWWEGREGLGPPPEIRTNREAMMAWMAEARRERARQERTNFVERAELKPEETVRFDVLMASLNLRLQQQSQKWREALDGGAVSRAEIRARAMGEISSALVLTYDELDRSMPTGWREVAGPDFNLMTFIEPEVWQDMRPIMRGGFRGGGPPGPDLPRR